MGLIQNYIKDFLITTEVENISYKVFDFDGVYKSTDEENVLFSCPDNLVPLDRSLVKRYEKPLKDVIFKSNLQPLNHLNGNSQFLYGTDEWTLGSGSGIAQTAPTIIEATDFNVKPLSGNNYLQANGTGSTSLLIKSDLTTLRQGFPIEIAFSYNVQKNIGSLSGKYSIGVFCQLDTSGNGTPDLMYDFESNEFVTFVADGNGNATKTFQVENNITDKWVGFRKTLEPFQASAGSTDPRISVGMNFPSNLALGDLTHIDNFTIAEKFDVNISKMKSVRRQFSYLGGFTGVHETESIFSNELSNDNNFVGQIESSYERARETVLKSLEQITTQQILNDNRDFLTKYEGVFKNVDIRNLGLHNKLWINFGGDSLQEEKSGYLDSMKFDVKNATYEIRMHLPNQDNDALSTFKSIAE